MDIRNTITTTTTTKFKTLQDEAIDANGHLDVIGQKTYSSGSYKSRNWYPLFRSFFLSFLSLYSHWFPSRWLIIGKPSGKYTICDNSGQHRHINKIIFQEWKWIEERKKDVCERVHSPSPQSRWSFRSFSECTIE